MSRAASSRIMSTIFPGVLPVDSVYLRVKVLSLIFIKFASAGTDKLVLKFP
jgi:hypothetical protein